MILAVFGSDPSPMIFMHAFPEDINLLPKSLSKHTAASALSFIKRSAIPEGVSSIPAVSRYLLLPILSIVLLTRGSEMSPQNAIRALVTSVLTAKPKRMICITGITITIRTVLISLNMCRNSFLTEAQNSFIVIPPFPPFRPLS